jgi:hypothetical protein
MALSSCKTSTLVGLSAVPREPQSSRTPARATDTLLVGITCNSTWQHSFVVVLTPRPPDGAAAAATTFATAFLMSTAART